MVTKPLDMVVLPAGWRGGHYPGMFPCVQDNARAIAETSHSAQIGKCRAASAIDAKDSRAATNPAMLQSLDIKASNKLCFDDAHYPHA
jgi:hypothetical protein